MNRSLCLNIRSEESRVPPNPRGVREHGSFARIEPSLRVAVRDSLPRSVRLIYPLSLTRPRGSFICPASFAAEAPDLHRRPQHRKVSSARGFRGGPAPFVIPVNGGRACEGEADQNSSLQICKEKRNPGLTFAGIQTGGKYALGRSFLHFRRNLPRRPTSGKSFPSDPQT